MKLFYTHEPNFIELEDVLKYVKHNLAMLEITSVEDPLEMELYILRHESSQGGSPWEIESTNLSVINQSFEEFDNPFASWRVTEITDHWQDDSDSVSINSSTIEGQFTLKQQRRYTRWVIKEVGIAELARGQGV